MCNDASGRCQCALHYYAKVEKIYQMKSVRPKKFLGQHFLTHLPTAQAIADTVDACPDIPILEVGPGMGVMTQFIIPKNESSRSWRLILRVWPTYVNTFLNLRTTSSRTTF